MSHPVIAGTLREIKLDGRMWQMFGKSFWVFALGITFAMFSGCSTTGVHPTIWRPCSSPDVANIWDLKDGAELKKGVHALCVSGVSVGDSMDENVMVTYSIDHPWTSWLKTGARMGIWFIEADATIRLLDYERWGMISALQLHGGDNSPHAVLDGSLIVGKVLNPYPIGRELPKTTSIIYVGYRRGWFGDRETSEKDSDNFWTGFAGLELWIKRFGYYFSIEHLDPENPYRSLWWNPEKSTSYILVSSGLKLVY